MNFVRQIINSSLLDKIVLPENLKNREVEIIVLPVLDDYSNNSNKPNISNRPNNISNTADTANTANTTRNFNTSNANTKIAVNAVSTVSVVKDDNTVDSLVGKLNRYSNPALIHTEREAWANAVVDRL